jgi:hypothetical protein
VFDLVVHPFRVANITILLFLFAFNTLAIGLLADLSSKGLMNRKDPPPEAWDRS